MATYVQRDEVEAVLGGTIGDVPGSAAELTDAQIDTEIANAEAEVDLNLRVRYIVPLNPVPVVVKYITRDIAVQLCDWTFRMSKEYGSGSNPVRLRYDRAREVLHSIRDGLYSLDVPESSYRSDVSIALNPYEGDLITVKHLFGEAQYG